MNSYVSNNHCEVAMPQFRVVKDAQQFRVHAPGGMHPVFERLQGWMTLLGYPRQDIFGLTLALHEAATNGCRHGNGDDSSKSILVTYVITPIEVLVEVEDQGRGFNPSLVPDPLAEENLDQSGGRGLLLMRAYSSWMTFNPKGNRVTLCRRRSDL